MAIDRKIWKTRFSSWPVLPCPSCQNGNLKVRRKSISYEETSSSLADRSHEAWDPEWVVRRFSAILICTNPACGDKVFVCGDVDLEIVDFLDEQGEHDSFPNDLFSPQYFLPSPPVFRSPAKSPDEVNIQLDRAFSLYWSDTSSAANRLRVAVEALLNELSIPKKSKIKNGPNAGKFRNLPLHDRIEKFKKSDSAAGTQLMALKWLGNIGSHMSGDELSHSELLDAFEHFEFALDLIYVDTSAVLTKRAEAIVKKKGPVRTKK